MKQITKICVAGAGIMGMQIALNAAVFGYTVELYDSFPSALEKADTWIKDFLAKGVTKGRYLPKEATKALERLKTGSNIKQAVQDCDLFIEAIIEDHKIKAELFAQVSEYAPKDALIVSNSSYIGSSNFIEQVENPERLANLHYFNPAMKMKLVEIVRGERTSDETVDLLKAFVESIHKEFIIVNKEIEGFVVNRLLRALQNEAFYLFSEGIASFEDIDMGAEKGLNHPMGPFRLLDMTGIDICYYNRSSKYKRTGNEVDQPPVFLKEKFDKGEFGRKTGKGWYDYAEK